MANFDSGVLWDDPSVHYDALVAPPNHTMSQNKISAVLAAAALTNINTAIATIRTNLPFLLHLSDEERKVMIKSGDSSAGFIQQSLLFAAQSPEAMLAGFPAAEFAKDGALLTPLQTACNLVAQLHSDCTDTLMTLNSDLMAQSLDVYAGARANNRGGNYSAYVDTAKAHFAKGPRTPKTTPTP